MPPKRPTSFDIERLDQLQAIASPLREEIISRLCRMGPTSIPALARSLGRKPQALYSHMRKLQEVGLVNEVGVRETGGRPETLFDTLGQHYRVVYDPKDLRKRRALADGVCASLRRAERDLRAILESPDAKTRGKHRSALWIQKSAWVTRSELAELNHHLDAAVALLHRLQPEPGTSHQAILVGLHPAAEEPDA